MHFLDTHEKKLDTDLQYSHSNEAIIDEDEIIECIDNCLNRLGKSVAYTVYLNWSAVDRKKHLGILGDPRSFRTSLYGLFGQEQGRRIETFLVMKLVERFPVILTSLGVREESDFVLVINWLTHRARNADSLTEGQVNDDAKRFTSISFLDSIQVDAMTRWFNQEFTRLGGLVRSLSIISQEIHRERLENELAIIRSCYDGAIERKRLALEKKGAGPDPLAATADAFSACSELNTLATKLERMKEDIMSQKS